MSDAVLDAVQERGDAAALDAVEPGWRAALDYADAIHASGHDVTDATFARLADAWDPGQIAELTAVVGLAEYFNRFNNALRVEPTK